eukprot:11345043-Prorocentrum_lima.AAC.1
MTSSLVGSEMCIRDRPWANRMGVHAPNLTSNLPVKDQVAEGQQRNFGSVSYTHLTLPTICSV